MPTLDDRILEQDRAGPVRTAIRIEWLGLPRSAAVEALIRSEAAQLEAFASKPMVWKVRIHAPEHPHSLQDEISVSIEARARERQVVVSRADAETGTALREAFAALLRTFERRVKADRRAFAAVGASAATKVTNRRASFYSMLAA